MERRLPQADMRRTTVNCHYCHGVDTVQQTITRFCACDAPVPFIVENVPASVCYLCGDKAFSGDIVDTFEKIKNGEFEANDSRSVKVFDMEKLRQPPEANGEAANVFTSLAHPSSELGPTIQRKLPTSSSRVVLMESPTLPDPERSSAWSLRETPDSRFKRWQRPENLLLDLKLNPTASRIIVVPNRGS